MSAAPIPSLREEIYAVLVQDLLPALVEKRIADVVRKAMRHHAQTDHRRRRRHPGRMRHWGRS